jgi:hypothetical protein
LGGDLYDYAGVCEAYKDRNLDYIVERIMIDPMLSQKFSSYEEVLKKVTFKKKKYKWRERTSDG